MLGLRIFAGQAEHEQQRDLGDGFGVAGPRGGDVGDRHARLGRRGDIDRVQPGAVLLHEFEARGAEGVRFDRRDGRDQHVGFLRGCGDRVGRAVQDLVLRQLLLEYFAHVAQSLPAKENPHIRFP